MRRTPFAIAFFLAVTVCVSSCSSTSNGTYSVEARGAIGLETAGIIAGDALIQGGVGRLDGDRLNGLGYGLGASINTTAIDLIGGFDDRIHDHQDFPELSIGLRKRFGSDKYPLYLFATARSDRSHTDGEETFNGTALGAGLLIQFEENGFIDMNMA